jgi:hypothetical protein
MRIWDINPGYLNRQSLLGEHRELHAIVSIVVNHKKGYANHPETLRWAPYGWALQKRHALLAVEMALRGYTDRSPVELHGNPDTWPSTYVDPPGKQFDFLETKYKDKAQGRMPLPQNTQQLWRQHKYSVLSRDVSLYKDLGRWVSEKPGKQGFSELAQQLTETLQQSPSQGGIRNALQHMWGYVNTAADKGGNVNSWPPLKLLQAIQERTQDGNVSYLFQSTVLSELRAWI